MELNAAWTWASYCNIEEGMTSFVFVSSQGGYGISLRDDDSGEFVSVSIHGINTLEEAMTKAKQMVNMDNI